MRREWIEILDAVRHSDALESPSMRREWIEMFMSRREYKTIKSPSMRREWIEISARLDCDISSV